MIKNSAEKAEKIIAVSEFTKKDIIETLGIENEKIRVIHEGIDVNKFSDEFDDGILSKFEQSMNSFSPFILSVGHLEPRKNYVRLIQAYELLKRKYKIKHKLVIVGQKNWKFQKIYEEVDKLKLRSDVVFTNFVDIKHLVFLYQRADLFVTASTYEGFGFTPLESMAAGTPVAVSNCTSLPEIVGDAALLFNPFDPDDIAEKMYTILMDENTRTRLVKKGKENINRFSWNRCCEETVKLYDEVLDEIG
ncbi:glycosyltransferase family 4 protein [candidate division KSB1 bacterium]|nr:glycosyltransferase family 4 protein [candidate division KSB1 bacterium]